MADILQSLFDECLAIRNKYTQDNRTEADQFNIFRITSIDRKETKTHTPILMDLLDRNGSHGQGTLFFHEFLSLLSRKGIIAENDIDLFANSKYLCEREKRNEEGQLDLKISCDNINQFCFIIENKIDAQDGDKQLERYWAHLDKLDNYQLNYKKLLIYLTPTGRKPSAESISSELKKNLKEKRILHCLSYLDIKEWLNRANDKVEATKVKVLLNQYVEIASEIGGETIMAGIQGKYTDLILKNDDYFRMAIELSSVTEKAKKKLAIEFLHKMIPVFQKELGEEWKVSYYGEGIGVDFRKIVWSRTYHHIDFDGCNFSIGVSNNEDKPLLKEGWCDKQEFINFAVNYDLRDCKSGDTWLWQAYTYGKYNIELKMPCVDNLIKYKNSDSDLMLYYVDCMRVLIDISTPLINKLESRRLG